MVSQSQVQIAQLMRDTAAVVAVAAETPLLTAPRAGEAITQNLLRDIVIEEDHGVVVGIESSTRALSQRFQRLEKDHGQNSPVQALLDKRAQHAALVAQFPATYQVMRASNL